MALGLDKPGPSATSCGSAQPCASRRRSSRGTWACPQSRVGRRHAGGRLPNTLLLMGTALIMSLALGILLGVFSAFRQGSPARQGPDRRRLRRDLPALLPHRAPRRAGVRRPPLCRRRNRFFPATGIRDPISAARPPFDTIHHLILPAVVLAFGGTATFMRYTRASVLEVMRQEYVTTAHSKGLTDRRSAGVTSCGTRFCRSSRSLGFAAVADHRRPVRGDAVLVAGPREPGHRTILRTTTR